MEQEGNGSSADGVMTHTLDSYATVAPVPPPRKYSRIGNQLIRPLLLRGEINAFDAAQTFYAHHPELDFADELVNYHREGYVVSFALPPLFAMVKAIPHPDENDKRRGWYIRFAVGDLIQLLELLPCQLEFIAFCREGDQNLRIIEWESFFKTVRKLYVVKAAA